MEAPKKKREGRHRTGGQKQGFKSGTGVGDGVPRRDWIWGVRHPPPKGYGGGELKGGKKRTDRIPPMLTKKKTPNMCGRNAAGVKKRIRKSEGKYAWKEFTYMPR